MTPHVAVRKNGWVNNESITTRMRCQDVPDVVPTSVAFPFDVCGSGAMFSFVLAPVAFSPFSSRGCPGSCGVGAVVVAPVVVSGTMGAHALNANPAITENVRRRNAELSVITRMLGLHLFLGIGHTQCVIFRDRHRTNLYAIAQFMLYAFKNESGEIFSAWD